MLNQNNVLVIIVFIVGLLFITKSEGCTDITPKPPIVAEGLHVAIIEETNDRIKLPATQLSIFTNTKIREYVNQHAAKVNGVPEFRIFDVSDTELSGESQLWKDVMKLPHDSVPWLFIFNGTKGFSGPLPKTVDETLALIQKYGD